MKSRTVILMFVPIIALMIAAGAWWFTAGSAEPTVPLVTPGIEHEAGDNRVVFGIVPEESEARFLIDEVLLGEPKTVIGSTHQIVGEMLIDTENPANSVFGAVQVNLKTLQTDNEIRNRALRAQILETTQAEFELAHFMPDSVESLPEQVTLDSSYPVEISGTLNVHGVSRYVTFSGQITPVNENRVEGLLSTSIQYRDFDIAIPEAPGVANVADMVRLEVEFVAAPVIND